MTTATMHTDRMEFDIVATGARTRMDEASSERFDTLLDQDPDWERVVALAWFHGVQSLLFGHLEGRSGLPDGLIGMFHRGLIKTAASNLMQARELARLRGLLNAEGLDFIAFKGPILAAEVYGNLGFRPSTDLDILVDADKYQRVEQLLQEDGYGKVVRKGSGEFARAIHRYLAQQTPFVKERNYAIDVHMNVMPPGYYYAFSFETLMERSHMVTVGDAEVRSFETEDLLQVLCYHGVKNRYERLKHVCDIAELVNSDLDLNWNVVMRRARDTRGEGILNLGLYMAHFYFRADIPPEILERVRSDKRAVKFGEWLIERMPNNMETGMPGFGERFRLYLGVQDTLVNKARYCIYSVLRRME